MDCPGSEPVNWSPELRHHRVQYRQDAGFSCNKTAVKLEKSHGRKTAYIRSLLWRGIYEIMLQ